MIKNPNSVKSFMLYIYDGLNTIPKTGTAFIYEHKKQYYLITNWHNVTGRHALNHSKLDLNCPIQIRFSIPMKNKVQVIFLECSIDLYKTNDQQQTIDRYNNKDLPDNEYKIPVWLEHNRRSEVDCVAIPITPIRDDYTIIQVNDGKHYKNTMVGCDAMVLGYPAGISVSDHLPIWKRASIASEIDISINDLPMIYIDVVGAKGMSGSPVFASLSPTASENGGINLDNLYHPKMEFLGCYSGRLSNKDIGSQLGIVWKEQSIIDIINEKIRGISSFKLLKKEYIGNEKREYDLWVEEEYISKLNEINNKELNEWKKINNK